MRNVKRKEVATRNGIDGRSVRALPRRQWDRDAVLQELCVCSPLAALHGYRGLLLAGELGKLNPDQTRVIEAMRFGVAKLWKSVKAVDKFVQFISDSTRPWFQNYSFRHCLDGAVPQVLPELRKKRINLRVDVEPALGGFSTCPRMVEAQRGRIRAGSTGPGTTFSLLLPALNAIQVQDLHLSPIAV
jgi:hypothetical protein